MLQVSFQQQTVQDLSISSVSTMSYEDDEHNSHSSVPTSTNSSPYNKPPFKDETSPDLLQTGFYNSENNPIDHVTNFRKSIILSDSMESIKFKNYQENETKTFGMTNSPSLADLANILERKSKPKESVLRNQSMETIIQEEEEEDDDNDDDTEEILETLNEQETPQQADLINFQSPPQFQYQFQSESPNLIQFDDDESIANSQNHTIISEQEDDIFKTPKIEDSKTFQKQSYRSMLENVLEDNETHRSIPDSVIQVDEVPEPSVPEIIKTPQLESIVSNDEITPKITKIESIKEEKSKSMIDDISSQNSDLSKPLPKQESLPLPKKQSLASKRSSSLPALPSKAEKKEKKKGFMSLFKSKKSELEIPANKRSVSEQLQEKSMKTSKSFQLPKSEPKVAKRSTSSTSLFNAFKRKSRNDFVDGFDFQTKPTSRGGQYDDEFHEDFNRFKISSPNEYESPKLQTPIDSPVQQLQPEFKPQELQHDDLESIEEKINESSIIAQGETLFPKSLNPQEVESIVSIERNRSVISKHSISSNKNPRRSLTDQISYNARESGMSIEIGRESSIPDLTKSPQSSVLKKKPSIGSFNYFEDDEFQPDDEELFNVEEFSQSLDFDNIIDNSLDSNVQPQEEQDDISKLIEFADFIDFGGDLDLGFDNEYEETIPNPSPEKYDLNPLSSPPLNQDTFSIQQESIKSQSPLNSPFLQQDKFIPTNSTISRPISMSFKSLQSNLEEFDEDSEFQEDFNFYKPSSPIQKQKQLNIKIITDQRKVTFSSKITLYDAFNEEEYDRHPDIATCNQLTPQIAQMIKNELNTLKSEMPVHEDSRCYTHFF